MLAVDRDVCLARVSRTVTCHQADLRCPHYNAQASAHSWQQPSLGNEDERRCRRVWKDLLDVETWRCLLFVAGGLTAVIWTDFIQTIIMLVGAVYLMIASKS